MSAILRPALPCSRLRRTPVAVRLAARCAFGAALCFAAPAGAAVTLLQGIGLDGPYELRGYANVAEDLRLADDVPDTVQTRPDRLRSARLGLRLRWHDDWIFRVAGNFARQPSLRDLALEYRAGALYLSFGRFPEPFSLGASLSSSDTLLISRPSPTFLGPVYGFGGGFSYRGRNWAVAGGAFSRDAGPSLSGRYPENAVSARATWRPLLSPAGYLHLGFSASLREAQKGAGVQLFGAGESVLVTGFAPRSPHVADSDRYHLLGAETAIRLGTVVLISEYIRADVDSGPHWHGEYVEAAWALSGERRSYSTRYGIIGGIEPIRPLTQGGFGAWELATRASSTDLRDGGGDRGRIAAVGLNWYPLDRLRLSVGAQRELRELAAGTQRTGNLVQLQLRFGL